MPKLSTIQKKDETVEVNIDFGGGESLNVVAYPNRITGRRRKEFAALDDDDYEGYAALYFDIFKSWDLTDDEGNVLPFDVDTIELLSIPTSNRIMKDVMEASLPTTATSKRSRGR